MKRKSRQISGRLVVLCLAVMLCIPHFAFASDADGWQYSTGCGHGFLRGFLPF